MNGLGHLDARPAHATHGMNSHLLPPRRAALLSALFCTAVSLSAQEFEPIPKSDAAAILADPIQLLIGPSLGQVTFDGALFYRYTHASGLPSAPGVQRSTDMHTATVSASVDVGSAFSVSYAISGMMFSSEAFDDTISHDLDVTLRRAIADWNTILSHRYAHASVPLLETGRQTRYDLNTTSLRADRRLGQKTQLQLGLRQGIRSTDSFSDYVTWSTDNWLHYLISPVVTTSAGYSYGYTRVDHSPDMDFHQLRGRVRWQLSSKLNFDFRAGVESRRVVDGAGGTSNTPIYGIAAMYSPGETTTLSLVADRSVSPSYFRSQTTRNTDWRIAVSQRLLEHFRLNVGYGRSNSDFRGTLGGAGVTREDERESYDAALSTTFAWGGSISVTYRRYENDSSVDNFSVSGRMIGVELSYGF